MAAVSKKRRLSNTLKSRAIKEVKNASRGITEAGLIMYAPLASKTYQKARKRKAKK